MAVAEWWSSYRGTLLSSPRSFRRWQERWVWGPIKVCTGRRASVPWGEQLPRLAGVCRPLSISVHPLCLCLDFYEDWVRQLLAFESRRVSLSGSLTGFALSYEYKVFFYITLNFMIWDKTLGLWEKVHMCT